MWIVQRCYGNICTSKIPHLLLLNLAGWPYLGQWHASDSCKHRRHVQKSAYPYVWRHYKSALVPYTRVSAFAKSLIRHPPVSRLFCRLIAKSRISPRLYGYSVILLDFCQLFKWNISMRKGVDLDNQYIYYDLEFNYIYRKIRPIWETEIWSQNRACHQLAKSGMIIT